MPTSSNEPTFDAQDALSEALRIYLEHRAHGSGESDSRLLARHPKLRELLEPLLAQDVPTTGDLRPGSTLGDFRLIEVIGRGGMGEVWEAEQLSLQRRVALKLLRAQLFSSPYAVERFRREALAGARLKHPGIVAVYSVGEQDGVHFIAQELVESRRTLSNLIRDTRELPAIPPTYWREIAACFARIAEALQLAHEAGVIHRDIKPTNILLDADGTPKVADFGLALVTGELELSRTGDMSGSPFYMSPEQAAAKRTAINERSDVFSLGATLFEALTLQRPFDGDTLAQVLTKIMFDDPRDPREIRSMCPRELGVICLKMLEKSQNSRYASMREVADELGRFLRNEPIHARPPGIFDRALKWSRRHPVIAASSAIVCVSLCVVSALLLETQRAHAAALKSAAAATASAIKESESAATARLELRTSTRVVDFLVDAFVEVSPNRTLGRELSAREVLDRGVKNIRSGLTDPKEAALRARLLDSLGMVYSRLGLRKEAEDLLLEARKLGDDAFAKDDPRALDIAAELAVLWADNGRNEAAAELMGEVHAAHVAREGANSRAALRAEGNLGSILSKSYELDGAEQHLRHAVEGLKALGEWRAPGLYTLSEVLRAQGKQAESLVCLHEALDLNMTFLGPDNPDTLGTLEGLARHEALAGHVDEARRLFRQVADSKNCVLGPKHPAAIWAQATAVYFESMAGSGNSLQELRDLYALSMAELGPLDPTTSRVTKYFSDLLQRMGRDDEAEVALAGALASLAGLPGSSPAERAVVLLSLANVEWHLARPELAVALLDEVIGSPVTLVGSATRIADSALSKAIEMREIMGDFEPALALAKARLESMDAAHPERTNALETVHRLEQAIADQ